MKPHLEWWFEQTRQFPILDVGEEQGLARRWRDTKDAAAARQLLHNRSLVTIGAGPASKKLFFRLRRLKSELGELGDGDLPPDAVTRLARQLEVSEDQVGEMNRRLAATDQSLSAPMHARRRG